MASSVAHRLVILYGTGGLSDVGRHAVQAALERTDDKYESIHVLTKYPELLDESNWKCGCEKPHKFSEEEKTRFTLVPIQSWQDDDLSTYFSDDTKVISCLGNRQPFIGGWESEEGNKAVLQELNKAAGDGKQAKNRVVSLTSVGVEEDWPPCEWVWVGKILAFIFLTIGRKSFRDLTNMERAYRESTADYLLVRPVGIGEDVVPVDKWFLQKEKGKDKLGFNMAKLDVARYMVGEALRPTRHEDAVVIGSEPPADSK